jgi:hypothetical protein
MCRALRQGAPERCGALSGVAGSPWVATDDHAGYARVLPALGVSGHVATAAKEATHGEPGLVNAMRQRPREFLLPFHGASTKWLGHYLACFLWLEQARHSGRDRGDMLSGQLAGGGTSIRDAPSSRWSSPSGTTGRTGAPGQSWSNGEMSIPRSRASCGHPIPGRQASSLSATCSPAR